MLQREVGRICAYVIRQLCLPDFPARRRRSSLDDAEKVQVAVSARSQLLFLHVLRSNLLSADRGNELIQLALGQSTR
ncbi:MAG: hypothetical protein SFY67_09010 [Candidatus Melainabacteria bacterium]|nr:hypothetical protein [Candidatus Melainabacteria bacterium]